MTSKSNAPRTLGPQLGRRGFLFAGGAMLAGCSVRQVASPPSAPSAPSPPPPSPPPPAAPPPSSGSPTLIGPGAAWNGTPGSGYAGSPPADPTRTTAKPAVRMRQAWYQRFASNLVIGVDAAAVGGIQKVVAYVEGATVDLGEMMLNDADVNGRTRRRQGFYIELNRTAFTNVSANGAIDIYFKAVPNDSTMQARVIGPYRFYPRATEFSNTYNIGSGQTYADLGSAIAAAKAMNGGTGDTAPLFLLKNSGNYEVNSDAGVLSVPEGYWVVKADTGVTATIRRANLPDDPGENTSCWKPGVRGLEFRGKSLTLDYKNMWYIYLYPAVNKETRFNGCRMVNSAGRDSTYFYGQPHFPGSLTGGTPFIEDCYISDMPDCLGGAQVASCNRVINTLFSGPVGTAYASQNVIKNIDSSFFFHADNALTITHNGSGSARIYTTGTQGGGGAHNADYFLKFERPVGTVIYTLKLGRKLSDGNNTWAQVLATLQAAPELSAFSFAAYGNNFWANTCTGVDATLSTGQSKTLQTYFDFHQDFFHAQTLSNVIFRGNVVYEEGYTVPALGGAAGFTFWRLADAPGYQDIMGLDNACDISAGGNGSPCSHVYIGGHSYGREGFTPASGWDNYSRFEDNIQSLYWAVGTVASGYPHFVNNHVISQIAASLNALPGPYNTGNVMTNAGSGQRAASQAMFVNATTGDFRPAGAALSNLVARGHSRWCGRGYTRNATDAPGAWSVNAPAPEWPFAKDSEAI